ncbi:glycosyltransferase family 2 protein [Phyllobacterium lublinensis]|uniref:glycosyltransferase family 2 protein n=1 Tax=Phyllobacterium lublinensis TaxID=2875708 RepID=UPI001CCC3C12|nr:glycosyltransferase family 2 protein [Phyllobacterium sp. 2063]MBZ9654687.1 glycosyltransferase family 2 protein [Phyllobacterium sp. 2063]
MTIKSRLFLKADYPLKRHQSFLFPRMEIPFPYRPDSPAAFPKSKSHTLLARWRNINARKRHDPVQLFPLRSGDVRPLGPEDIPLIFLAHNSIQFLPSFLAHYRSLGVTRFLCVDDQSTDGTREKLLEQNDVDVFGSQVRYRQANGGNLWREALVRIFGTKRWYMNVDCDEYFIYDRCETRKLPELITALEARGVLHCPAPMIDCYPSKSLKAAIFDGSTDVMPWQIANSFDRIGYRLFRTSSTMSMMGGPRDRLMADPEHYDELMKYPLLYVEHEIAFTISIHKPWPFDRNFSPIYGSLLHFKFFSETEEFVKKAIEGGQYFKGSRAYKTMLEAITAGKLDNLNSEVSVQYEGSEQLLDLGFFKSPF